MFNVILLISKTVSFFFLAYFESVRLMGVEKFRISFRIKLLLNISVQIKKSKQLDKIKLRNRLFIPFKMIL